MQVLSELKFQLSLRALTLHSSSKHGLVSRFAEHLTEVESTCGNLPSGLDGINKPTDSTHLI